MISNRVLALSLAVVVLLGFLPVPLPAATSALAELVESAQPVDESTEANPADGHEPPSITDESAVPEPTQTPALEESPYESADAKPDPSPAAEDHSNPSGSSEAVLPGLSATSEGYAIVLADESPILEKAKKESDRIAFLSKKDIVYVSDRIFKDADNPGNDWVFCHFDSKRGVIDGYMRLRRLKFLTEEETLEFLNSFGKLEKYATFEDHPLARIDCKFLKDTSEAQPTLGVNPEPTGAPEPGPGPTLEPEFIQTPVPEPGTGAASESEGSLDQEPALLSEESPQPTDAAPSSAEPAATPDGDISLEPDATPDGEVSLEPETSPHGEGALEPETSPDMESTPESTETLVPIEESPEPTGMPIILLDGFMDLGDGAAITVPPDTAESAVALPEILQATSGGAPMEVSVTWTRADAAEWRNGGIYAFLPVLPGGYALAEGIQLPQILVTVGETQSVSISIDPVLASPGDTVTLTATVTGYEDASFQWQWAEIPKRTVDEALDAIGNKPTDEQLKKTSEDMAVSGKEADALIWTDEPGATGFTHHFSATETNTNRYWRIMITVGSIGHVCAKTDLSIRDMGKASVTRRSTSILQDNQTIVSAGIFSLIEAEEAAVAKLSIYANPKYSSDASDDFVAGEISNSAKGLFRTLLVGRHSWLYFKNTSSSTLKIGAYLLEPDRGLSIGITRCPMKNAHDGDGIYYNNEAYIEGTETAVYTTIDITSSDIATINALLPTSNYYDLITFNCTTFAIGLWNSVAPYGKKIEPQETPLFLSAYIATHFLPFHIGNDMKPVYGSEVLRYVSNTSSKHVTFLGATPTLSEPEIGHTYKLGEKVTLSWSDTWAERYKLTLCNAVLPTIEYIVTDTDFTITPSVEGTWTWKVASYAGDDLGYSSGYRTFYVNKQSVTFPTLSLLKPEKGASLTAGDTVCFQWTHVGATLYRLNLLNTSTGETYGIRTGTDSWYCKIPSAGSWRWNVDAMENSANILASSDVRYFSAASAPVISIPGIPSLQDPSDGSFYNVGDTINFRWDDKGAAKYRLTVICDTGTGTFAQDVSGTSYTYTANIAGSWRWQVQSYIGGALGDAPHTRSFIVRSSSTATSSGMSVHAEYFAGIEANGNVLSSQDLGSIDLNWGNGSPSGVPVDGFSAKFTAQIPMSEGWHRFHYEVDDAIKIWVGSHCITDRWGSHVLSEYSPPVYFYGGTNQVVFQYADMGGEAKIKVRLEDSYAPSLTIYSPAGEATFTTGETVNFRWSDAYTPLNLYWVVLTNVDSGRIIQYRTSDTTSRDIVMPEPGRWRWRVDAMYNSINVLTSSQYGYITITPPAPTKPDLKLSDIQQIALPDNGYFFSADILNGTQVAASSFKVRWFVDGEKKAEYTCPGLAGNATLVNDSYGFEWYPVLSGSFQITVDVDGVGQLDETDELNNSATTTLEVSLPPPAPDYEYTFENNEAVITGYIGSGADVSVPASILGAPVTRIDFAAFQDDDWIETVDLPDSIRAIGGCAFAYCSNLRDINLPEGLETIENEAFASTAIQEIVIPSTVTAIGDDVFDQCDALSRISVTQGNTAYCVVNGALMSDDRTSLLRFPPQASATAYTVPDTVTDIRSTAFLGCGNLMSIALEEGIQHIGERAFVGCDHLTGIALPATLEEIAYPYFYNCSALAAVDVDPNCENYMDNQGALIDRTSNALICYPEGKNATTYTVPASVEEISDLAFYNNQFIKRIDLSDHVRQIEGTAFLSCPNLERITIPPTVEYITPDAVTDCDNVTIYGEAGSAAEQFAASVGIPFVDIRVVEPDPVESIRLEVDDNYLVLGGSMTIYAEVLPESAEQTLRWTCSNTKIASVSDDGTVEGISPGAVTITAAATDGSGKKASVKINVFRPVTSVTLNKTSGSLLVGKSLTLTATVKPTNASYKTIEWESSDPSVATVNSKGMVTAIGVGETTITAGTNFGATGDEIAEFLLTVTPAVQSIELTADPPYIQIGDSIDVSAEVLPEDALQTLRWTTSNSRIAKVSDGMVIGVAPGKATITAYATDGSGEKAGINLYVYRPVTSIKLNKSSGNLITGKTLALTASIKPSNATYKTVVWESSDSDVANVDNKGMVTAISAGEATITARTEYGATGDEYAECALSVTTAVQSITLTADSPYLQIGDFLDVNAEILPEDALQSLRWTTSNSKIAQVADGTVTGVAPGKATITAYAADGSSKKASITLYVYRPVTSITLNKAFGNLLVGKALTLIATIKPSSATYKTIVWESSDPDVATVNSKGVVTAVAAGEATITARTEYGASGDEYAEFLLTVTPAVQSIELTANSPYVPIGGSIDVRAEVLPEDALQTLKWSSSNVKIATISDGMVTGIAPGMATITATAIDGSGKKGTLDVYAYRPVTSIALDKTSGELEAGDTMELTAAIKPSNATYKTIIWETGDPGVATVDHSGLVTAVGAGGTIITARTDYGATGDEYAEFSLTVTGGQGPGNPDYTYTVSDGEVTITGYTGAGGAISIPSTIQGLPVKAVADHAFGGNTSLTSVTVPDGVVSIGTYVFENCYNITSITLPNSVTSIGRDAFGGCYALLSMDLPDNVTRIEHATFNQCHALESVSISASVVFIGDQAFNYCTNLKSVTLPAGITSIEAETFRGDAALTSITIPDGVTSIGDYAFDGCGALATAYIPASVASISGSAFGGCAALTIHGYAGSYAQTYANDHGIPFIQRNKAVGFAEPQYYETSGVKFTVVLTKDFNKDNIADVAAVCYNDDEPGDPNKLIVYLGRGDGTFGTKHTYLIGTTPVGLKAADFNKDGNLDLAAACMWSDCISVLLGNGDGSFSGPTNFPARQFPSDIVVEDFDHDGNLDIATVNNWMECVSILKGDGQGNFVLTDATYAAGGSASQMMDTADLNDDGVMDIVVVNAYSQGIGILFGNGNGSFQSPVVYATHDHPFDAKIADLNHDGVLDIVVVNEDSQDLSVLIGNGGGTFKSAVNYSTNSGRIVMTDLNNDGNVDVAIGVLYGDYASILLGNGDGTFQNAVTIPTANYWSQGIASGDFNGDGVPDLVLAQSNNVCVLINNPSAA